MSRRNRKQPLSRAEREQQFNAAATQMFNQLEEWYDRHPDAQLEAIEQEARRVRRELMGEVLQIIINGRDTG